MVGFGCAPAGLQWQSPGHHLSQITFPRHRLYLHLRYQWWDPWSSTDLRGLRCPADSPRLCAGTPPFLCSGYCQLLSLLAFPFLCHSWEFLNCGTLKIHTKLIIFESCIFSFSIHSQVTLFAEPEEADQSLDSSCEYNGYWKRFQGQANELRLYMSVCLHGQWLSCWTKVFSREDEHLRFFIASCDTILGSYPPQGQLQTFVCVCMSSQSIISKNY